MFQVTDQPTLLAIADAYNQAQNNKISWGDVYQIIYDALTDEITYYDPDLGQVTTQVSKTGVDPVALIWIQGARKVNINEGAFAKYIRDYAEIQFHLRSGDQSADINSNLQQASNDIARNFAATFLGFRAVSYQSVSYPHALKLGRTWPDSPRGAARGRSSA